MKPERQTIDWEAVHCRLRESQRALDEALTASPERIEAVYRQRAAQLAARGLQTNGHAGGLRVLVFALGGERYGIEFADLLELLPLTGLTPVPGGPPPLLGVINAHGEIRSVVDLGWLLGLPAGDAGGGYVLLLRRRGRQAALRVDRVEAIQEVAPDQPGGPAASEGLSASFLRGITPDRVRLLDTDTVLSHPVFQAPA